MKRRGLNIVNSGAKRSNQRDRARSGRAIKSYRAVRAKNRGEATSVRGKERENRAEAKRKI